MVVVVFVLKIPTQKGGHSCKCTELSQKQKEGIFSSLESLELKMLGTLFKHVVVRKGFSVL